MPEKAVLRSEFIDALRAEFAGQVERIQFKQSIEVRDVELMFDAAILLALARFLPKGAMNTTQHVNEEVKS